VQHIWGREEVHTIFWWVNLKERDHFEDLSIDWMGRHGIDWCISWCQLAFSGYPDWVFSVLFSQL